MTPEQATAIAERCIAAGIDDTNPSGINVVKVRAAIERALIDAAQNATRPPATPPALRVICGDKG